MGRIVLVALAAALVAASCGGTDETSQEPPTSAPVSPSLALDPSTPVTPPTSDTEVPAEPPSTTSPLAARIPGAPLLADGSEIPPAPDVPEGPLTDDLVADLDAVFATLQSSVDIEALTRIGDSADARVAWLLSDLLRFFQRGEVADTSIASFERLTGAAITNTFAWGQVTDFLIAWDLPAPPGYVDWKRIPFQIIEPAWEPFFGDADAAIDWRLLSWGGVLIDDRPIDQMLLPCAGGCIPALDDPQVTDAAGGSWLDDDRLVFGVVLNGEARAYPKHMMEVHEMVNDTPGGRRIGIPYCTLCGSAQAYFADIVPAGFETIELRTSGLLSRSNKVMFDLHTFSVFDTFLGDALSGPLQDEGYVLEMVTVVTSTWGDWKAAHPETTILLEDGGLGRTYSLDPLGGRDDNGPIFPVGAVDPRLPVQESVLGIVTADGIAVAFLVAQARSVLGSGGDVALEGVRLVADGGGLRAELDDGTPLASHESFWFAWSQFEPDTLVWTPLS